MEEYMQLLFFHSVPIALCVCIYTKINNVIKICAIQYKNATTPSDFIKTPKNQIIDLLS